MAIIAAAIAWLGLAQTIPASAADNRPAEVVVKTSTGSYPFQVEWAVTPEERAKGLMYRESMAPDHGMIFDFNRDNPVSFWMKNTYLSLDMVFIHADGRVARIEHGATPLSEEPIPSGEPVRYVLEVIAGTAERISLDPGDTVEIRR